MKTKYTDYDHSLISVASSILKHFGISSDKKSLEELDSKLINKKKIVLMLLDGMGCNIIKKNLEENSFLRNHQISTISSVFPPTTAAATTSVISNLYPIESGWLAWHLYLSSKDPSLILFRNCEYYSDGSKRYEGLNVNEKIGYQSIDEAINEKGYPTYSIHSAYDENGYKDFDSAIEALKKITNKLEESFTYFYWDNPDYLIHFHGTKNDVVTSLMHYFNDQLETLSKNLDQDTIIILLADHGLIDVEAIDFSKFKDLNKMLRKKISGEGRSPIFHVKKKELENFKILFNYYFGDYFDLYTKEEVIKLGIFGPSDKIHPSIRYSLGDYVAVATDRYYLATDLDFVFKGHHGGGTIEETEVPLIIIQNEEK